MPSEVLTVLIRIGAVLHFGVLIAAGLVPKVLDWRGQLQKVTPLLRQLVWVYGTFIVLTIVGFGTISLFQAQALSEGTPLARSLCGFIAVFWLLRLGMQFVFDAGPYTQRWFLKLGYYGLTAVFAYLGLVFGAAAILPM